MKNEISINYCNETIGYKQQLEGLFLMLGQRLARIREEELYKGSWDSFADYVQELDISESVASRLITTYKKITEEWNIDKEKVIRIGGWNNAYEISKIAQTKEQAEEMLAEVSVLSPSDRRIYLRNVKTGINQDECSHDFYSIKVCKKCQYKEKLYDL